MAGLLQEGDWPAERRLVTGRRRIPLRRLDRRRSEEDRRREPRPALHAPAEGQQLERHQRREGRPADRRRAGCGRPARRRSTPGRTRTPRSTPTRRPTTVLTDDETARFRADAGGLGGLAGTPAVVSADGHALGHERQAGSDARAAARRADRRLAGGRPVGPMTRRGRIVITDPAVATHEALADATRRLAALDLGDAFEPRAAEAIVAAGLHRLVVPAVAGRARGAGWRRPPRSLHGARRRRWLDGARVRDAGPRRRGAGRLDGVSRQACATGCSRAIVDRRRARQQRGDRGGRRLAGPWRDPGHDRRRRGGRHVAADRGEDLDHLAAEPDPRLRHRPDRGHGPARGRVVAGRPERPRACDRLPGFEALGMRGSASGRLVLGPSSRSRPMRSSSGGR